MRVYRFLNADHGLGSIQLRRLKISRLDELNDPFEMLGIAMSDPIHRRAFNGMKASLSKDHGLLCFSRRWSNPLLWSHYADRHRGLCLGFDMLGKGLRRVKYVDVRQSPAKLLKGDHLSRRRAMEDLLYSKFSHWRYEDEVRCFLKLEKKDIDTDLYFKDFSDAVALTQVIVGSASCITRNDVKQALAGYWRNVEVFKARSAGSTGFHSSPAARIETAKEAKIHSNRPIRG